MKWITLKAALNLGNVRAVLTFIISILCAVGIWIVGLARWRYHARKVTRTTSVRVLDLISVHGFGEAIDAFVTAAWTKQFLGNSGLLFQCLIVVVLTVVGILAGPIARYSTRYGTLVRSTNIAGLMTTSDQNGSKHDSIVAAQVMWNMTMSRLTKANFPQDQLLDFLPDLNADWIYKPREWNSTWKVNCDFKAKTAIDIIGNDNLTDSWLDQLPGARNAFPEDIKDSLGVGSMRSEAIPHGFYANNNMYKDILMFWMLNTNPSTGPDDFRKLKNNNDTMRLVLLAFHFHDIPRGNEAYFGSGPAEKAFYSRADCTVERAKPGYPVDEDHIAYLWTNRTDMVVQAMSDFYHARMVEQSIAETGIYLPPGEELLRFFQTYFITKDTQYKHSIQRTMSVKHTTVELAALALAAFSLFVLALLVLLLVAVCFYRVPESSFVPRTKLEWVMHCVRETWARDVIPSKFEASQSELREDVRKALYGPVWEGLDAAHIGITRDGVEYVYHSHQKQ